MAAPLASLPAAFCSLRVCSVGAHPARSLSCSGFCAPSAPAAVAAAALQAGFRLSGPPVAAVRRPHRPRLTQPALQPAFLPFQCVLSAALVLGLSLRADSSSSGFWGRRAVKPGPPGLLFLLPGPQGHQPSFLSLIFPAGTRRTAVFMDLRPSTHVGQGRLPLW
jgi:hypothetical protein